MGVHWRAGKASICPLEIDFLLRNTLILLYKLHFCIILPLPEVLPSLEIGHGTPMYAGFTLGHGEKHFVFLTDVL